MKKFITMITVACMVFVSGAVYADEPDLVVTPAVEDTGVETVEIYRSMEVTNPDLELSNLTRVAGDTAYLSLFSGLSVADTLKMWKDVQYLKANTNIKKIVMFLNSPGGSAFDGLAMAAWIEKFQEDDGMIFEVEASGLVASAAVPIFAVCKVRTAIPGTIFMVHEAAMWKWPGRETASDIQSQTRMMDLIGTRYINILVKHSNLSFDEWKEKEGATTWFTTTEAREWGLLD